MTTTRHTPHVKRKDVKRKTQSAIRNLPFAICLFLLALLPRALALSTFETVDEPNWIGRSVSFLQALAAGDWAGTLVNDTPGVTTCWAGIAGLAGRYLLSGGHGSLADFARAATSGRLDPAVLAAMRWPIVLLTTAAVVAVYFLVRALFDPRTALVASALLALEPLYLAHSRLLHLDALLTAFMTVSLLAALLGLRRGSTPLLVASGVAGGLAGLTKSPALFLFPFVGLLAVWHHLPGERRPGRAALLAARDLAVWSLAAGAIYVALWPALWADPLGTVWRVVGNALYAAGPAHGKGGYFLGRPTPDPGPLFYPVAWLFKSTPPVLIGLAAALAGRRQRRRVWPLVAYAVLFTAFVTLSTKKSNRYILPIFPALDIVAAVGLVWLARLRPLRPLRKYSLALAIVAQAALSLPLYPYYLTYHNPLAGGGWLAPAVMSVGWGEGLDRAARTLDRQPDAANMQVAAWYSKAFAPFFRGETVDLSIHKSALWADRVVFYVNQVQRQYPNPTMVGYFETRRPEHVVRLGGVDYAWVYPGPILSFDRSPRPQHPLDVNLGNRVRLLGFDVSPSPVPSGDRLHVTLYWQCLAPLGEDYNVFVRLLDEGGHRWASVDRHPLAGLWPAADWQPGLMVRDEYELSVPPGTPPGDYRLTAAMYPLASGQPLPVADGSAPLGPGGGPILGPVSVVRPRTFPRPDEVPMSHTSGRRLADDLTLLGYDFAGGTVPAGERVGLTLYWRATAEPTTDHTAVFGLVDAGGQPRAQWREPVGGERYPTSGWVKGEVVADRHELRIPPRVLAGQYRLVVALAGADATPATLGTVTVESRPRTFAVPPIQHPLSANFDDKIQLLGYATRNTPHSLLAGPGRDGHQLHRVRARAGCRGADRGPARQRARQRHSAHHRLGAGRSRRRRDRVAARPPIPARRISARGGAVRRRQRAAAASGGRSQWGERRVAGADHDNGLTDNADDP